MAAQLLDNFNRVTNYLRISVTDRCNLRCKYCMPTIPEFISHTNIIRYEELFTIIDVAQSLGIHKVRLTGGEPFARKGFIDFAQEIKKRWEFIDLRITTNATLLDKEQIFLLKDIGLNTINISLDTLREDVFQFLTGEDSFKKVRENIDFFIEAGIHVKINAVAMKGVNDEDLPAFIELAKTHPIELRFIEFMPIGDNNWQPEKIWTCKEILSNISELCELEAIEQTSATAGPAKLYQIVDGMGKIGLISPLSAHFCDLCNRLRITSTGMLRSCLFSDTETSLMDALHAEDPNEAIKNIFLETLQNKPLGYKLLQDKKKNAVCQKRMSAIGG